MNKGRSMLSILALALVSIGAVGCQPVGLVPPQGTRGAPPLLGGGPGSANEPLKQPLAGNLPNPGLEPPPLDPVRAEVEWRDTLAAAGARDRGDASGKLDLLIRGLASSQVIWRNVPRGSQPGGPDYTGHAYDLDGTRTPQQIVTEGRGGSCGSYGKVLADALIRSGMAADDVYLVDTVGESLRAETTAAARSGNEQSASASGHQFVLARDAAQGWLLVDTTARSLSAAPLETVCGVHTAAELASRVSASGYAADPARVRPGQAGPSGGPVFPNLVANGPDGPPAEIFGNLVAYRVVRSVDYRNHAFAERVQEVARVVPQ